MKKTLAFALALLLLTSCAALADTEYRLTYEGFLQYPLVSDGESVKISIAVPRNDTYGMEPDDSWWWPWIEAKTGIDFDVIQISDSARDEKLSLMFASGDIPDVIWGFGLTTDDIVLYGDEEELFAPLEDYFTNPEIMPNAARVLEAYPELIGYSTSTTGHIYTLPVVYYYSLGDDGSCFINGEWLEKLGLERPRTLDEFVSFLYAVKEADPSTVPLAGSSSFINPISYIINAFGYIQGGGDGTSIAVRNGEAVIPAATPEFKYILELMHQFYADGIISEDFFTLDATGVRALTVDGKSAVYGAHAGDALSSFEDFSKWPACYPLTSEYNDNVQWWKKPNIGIGGFAVSAKCQNIECVMRFADFLFSEVGVLYTWQGPAYDTEACMGLTDGIYYNEEGKLVYVGVENGKYSHLLSYHFGLNTGINNSTGLVGSLDMDLPSWDYWMQWNYTPDCGEPMGDDWTTSWGFGIKELKSIGFREMRVDGYPAIVYRPAEETIAMNELSSVLNPYMENQIAKFITGSRALDEYDAYLAELDDMGMGEYLGYYQATYANYLAK